MLLYSIGALVALCLYEGSVRFVRARQTYSNCHSSEFYKLLSRI